MLDFSFIECPESAQKTAEKDSGPAHTKTQAKERSAQTAPISLRRMEENDLKQKQIFQQHREAEGRAALIMTEILKGMDAGAALPDLFLKACEAVSLATGNTVFYERCRAKYEYLYAPYTPATTDPEQLLADAQKRLDRMKELCGIPTKARPGDNPPGSGGSQDAGHAAPAKLTQEHLSVLLFAIAAHEANIKQLKCSMID